MRHFLHPQDVEALFLKLGGCSRERNAMKLALLSDTHDLLRPEALAEQIIRLYMTHPGVSVDGIMTKMGL